MNCQLFFDQLCEVVGFDTSTSTLLNSSQLITGINTDSRNPMPGEIFVALRGEKFDGHNFVQVALDRGAIGLITEREIELPREYNVPQIKVADTLIAYQKIARWWRDQFNIPVVGITGSVGKTTTKELIASVLATQGQVLKTQANYNNEIGVPKTLLGLGSHHSYAVIEMAMRGRGEIALLSEIANPSISVITNVGTAHIGRLGSREAIAQAKCELLAKMPSDGIAILNHDYPLLLATAAQVWQGETITYGLEGGDIQGEFISPQILRVGKTDFPVPLSGAHNASNYLAALAVAQVLGIDWNPLTAGLGVTLPGGRARRYQLPGEILLLDETYNAGLESMIAALHLLRETPGKRHLGVLGTMKELGAHSRELHHLVGVTAQELGLDGLLVLVDEPETEAIVEGAVGINSQCFTTHSALVEKLNEMIEPGDCILFKASNSVGLQQVVQQLRSQWQG